MNEQQDFLNLNPISIFAKNITYLDCAIFDPAYGIIGQSWIVDTKISGNLKDSNLIYDFSELKKLIKQILNDNIDHKLVIPICSEYVSFNEDINGECWELKVPCPETLTYNIWKYKCPKNSVYTVRTPKINSFIIEQEISKILRHRLPSSINEVKIFLKEEKAEETTAFYKYTHGLSFHSGACQKLFHGHKSKIEIYIGDERRADLEHHVVRELLGSNVHIASCDQLLTGSIPIGQRGNSTKILTIGYQTNNGTYYAELPANKVFIVDKAPTIEQIALQIATYIKNKEKTKTQVRVIAYEGIKKGAEIIL